MNRELARGLAPIATIAAGLALGLSVAGCAAAANATSAPAKAAGADSSVVLQDCSFKPVVEPKTWTETCADYGFVLQNLDWASWAAGRATASGTAFVKLCQPNCAEGGSGTYPIRVVFSGSVPVKGHPGLQRYTGYTVTFTHAVPPGYKATQTFQM